MIYCGIRELKTYLGIHPNLDKAIHYIMNGNLQQLPLGLTEIDQKNVYCNKMKYKTIDEKEAEYESHFKYVDVHVVITGEEMFFVQDAEKLKETQINKADDYILFKGEPAAGMLLNEGKAAIVFPGEPHLGKIQVKKKPEETQKLVFKALID